MSSTPVTHNAPAFQNQLVVSSTLTTAAQNEPITSSITHNVPAVSHLKKIQDYIDSLKKLQVDMDPLIACTIETFNRGRRKQSVLHMETAKRVISRNDEIQKLSADLKATMSNDQRKEWAVLVNTAEEEWMSTVECVRKLQVKLNMNWVVKFY
ncbi:hypothetical protein Q9L58_006886 [Maublancomyces gigas]|uniref:Biogenesis of lysosome-related organelles complex 1 subunit 1 n=1 Tax=Discina gigas TaxID=1032678 RepID=A0ABR3GEJ0_9PEZI